jgi:hypothetical protein
MFHSFLFGQKRNRSPAADWRCKPFSLESQPRAREFRRTTTGNDVCLRGPRLAPRASRRTEEHIAQLYAAYQCPSQQNAHDQLDVRLGTQSIIALHHPMLLNSANNRGFRAELVSSPRHVAEGT